MPLGARMPALQLRLLTMLLEPLLRERIRRVPARVHREVVRVLLVRRQRDVLAQTEHQVGLYAARIVSATRTRSQAGKKVEVLGRGTRGGKRRDTHVREERPAERDELLGLLRDLERGLAVEPARDDDGAGRPELVHEVRVDLSRYMCM